MTQYIQDFTELKKYRTELPNLYDDIGLDVYEFRLLAHYKRVGTCTEGTHTTADKCGMSKPQLIKTRQALAERKLISLKKVPCPGGFAYEVEVVDVWLENFAKYSGLTTQEIIQKLNSGVNHMTPSGKPHDPQGSPRLLKEESTTSIFSNFQNNIQLLTPMMKEILMDAEKEYPADWINEAIGLAVHNNKRNWRYIEAILKRWKEQGKDSGKGGKPKPEEKRPEYQLLPSAAEEEDWIPAPPRKKVMA